MIVAARRLKWLALKNATRQTGLNRKWRAIARDARPLINESREQMLFRQGLFCRFMAAVRYMPQPGIGRQQRHHREPS